MGIRTDPPLPAQFAAGDQPPFVGRRREIERLEDVWEEVQRGQRQAVFLGGEPGSGKSRLAAEMARGLHSQGVAVLVGSSSRDLSRPYGALVKVLDHLLLGTEPGALAATIPDSAGELLRLTPHLGLHRPDLTPPVPGEGENREALLAAYVDLIAALTVQRPLAIVLEDMHWSSSASQLLMSRIVETIDDRPLLVLATMRTTAPDRSDHLSRTMADLYRLSGIHRIDLPGLEADDVEKYLCAELGRAEPHLRETAALLHDQTGGNPLFLREVWREVRGIGGVQAIRSHRFATPSTVRDALERRIHTFEPADRTVLEHAAVLGDAFDASSVVDAVDAEPIDSLKAFDRAVDAGLIALAGAGRYAFQHALIRQALLEGLSPSKSATTHARLAEALREQVADERRLAPVLARLYEGASALGHRDDAVFFLDLAASTARQSLAHEEAAELWEHAASLVDADRRERERLLLSAARAHVLAGDFARSREIYRKVNGSDDAHTAVRAAIGFEDASWRPGILGTDAKAILESTIDRIAPDPGDPLYVAACIALSRACTFAGELATSARLGGTSLAMARALGDDDLVADAIVAETLRTMTMPRADDTVVEMALELRETALRSGDYDRLAPAGSARTADGYIRADRARFRDGWADIRLAADKTGQPFWRWVDGCQEYVDRFVDGSFDDAMAAAVRVRDLGDIFGDDSTEGPFGLQMYMVQRETGGLDAVRNLISGDPSRDGTWTPGLLALYTELGMKDAVRSLMGRTLALPRTMNSGEAIYAAVVAFMADAAVYLGDEQVIRKLLPSIEPFDGVNLLAGQCVAVFGSGNTYLGRMYAALGEYDLAEHHFRTGLTMDVSVGSIVHQTWTLAHYSDLLDATGRPDDAEAYRRRARELAEPIGQERVLRLVRDPGAVGGPPDGLTPREVEVLELLAEGASNKDIAAQLFISQNTAANHVRNILMKTGSANRTAAAAYARQHDLV